MARLRKQTQVPKQPEPQTESEESANGEEDRGGDTAGRTRNGPGNRRNGDTTAKQTSSRKRENNGTL